jgi:uncharacterized protein
MQSRTSTQTGPAGPARAPEPFVARPFHPARWLPGAHAQTIAGKYVRPKTGVAYRRERVDTPDGDFLDLDFATVEGGPELAPDTPLLVLVHGLEGSAQSGYVLETCRAAYEHGMRAVAMNFRSCSGELNRARRFYHAGETSDLAFVLDLLASRYPAASLGAVGFSLGANVLLKYLGERGDSSRARAAAAVSIPFDLGSGSEKLSRSFLGRAYMGIFIRSLQRKFNEKRPLIGDAVDAGAVLRARTLRDFDDAATARLHGFHDVDHYYGSQSSKNYLHGIRVPTLLVHALDDPFVDENAIPYDAIEANPHLVPVFTDAGGHVAFVTGPPWAPRFWAEREAARFLAPHLGGRNG